MTQLDVAMQQKTRARSSVLNPTNVTLVTVFLCMSGLYLWRTADAVPLALHGSSAGQYNALADAFLHLRLWIAHFPASLLGPEPLNPELRPPVTSAYGDDSLYGQYLYISWGPAPVLALVLPLHLLGYEPSGSVIIAPFAIAGLGFALAALRVGLRQIGDVPLWMCVMAAFTLACASVVPELLGAPEVYHEAIAGGYCFTMAGVWLAVSAIADRRASLVRLGLMSLCFGLATGSRPTLGLTAVVLVPVFMALKATQPRRSLLVALMAPVGACFLLLLAYNYVRYGDPLEIGTMYQLGAPAHQHLGELDYLPIGIWAYLLTPPRLTGLFPFVSVVAPQLSYPLSLPAHYVPYSEQTGGLLPMAPIVIFVAALPMTWRHRPALFGSLGPLLLVMAVAGVGIVLILSYALYGTTERYEADYATLFVFGALLVWLALSGHAHGWRRGVIQVGGGLLATWSCATGLAIGAHGLQKHPDTWRTLVSLGSPLSTAIAAVAGHPILAEVYAPNIVSEIPESYGLGTNVSLFSLGAREEADLTIVSPIGRDVTLAANVSAVPALNADARLEARIRGSGLSSQVYPVPVGGGEVRMVTHVGRGLTRLVLGAVVVAQDRPGTAAPLATPERVSPLMVVSDPHLVAG